MKEKLKNKSWYICTGAAFVLPALLFVAVLWSGGFYPFGEKSMLIMDMRDQNIAFFTSLRDALFGDNSLFFSWSRSMGGNYWGLFTFYISSPLSFITLFFPVEDMPVAVEILTVLKVGLCGLSFFIYSRYLTKRREELFSQVRMPILLLILSTCYAFMSYNMVYSMSLMWIDGVILLPLVLLGVEKILDGEKGVFYLIVFSLLLVSNYYTGYMVGIYMGMYLLFRILTTITKETRKDSLWKALRVVVLSILSIGVAGPVLLGSWKGLTQGKLASGGREYSLDFSQTNFSSIGDLIGKYTNGNYDSITNSGLPAIYCGYFVLALVIVFFLLRKIRLREKVGMVIMIGILSASLYYTSLDMAWHGFQVPNWFPYRYAFLFSFTLIYMACRALIALPEKTKIPEKWRKQAEVTGAVLLLVLVTVEMDANAVNLLAGLDGEFAYVPASRYEEIVDRTKPLVDGIKEQDDGLYRINQGYEFSKNDAMLFGYHGMTHYSSTFNAAVNSLTPRLGISQGYFWNSGYGSNAMLDSLFAVKYIMADKTVPASYTHINDSGKGTAAYANPSALPIAYASAPSTMTPEVTDVSPFVNQNHFLQAIAGTQDNYFTALEYRLSQNGYSQIGNWNYEFTADSDNPVYLYMRADGTSYANVFVNDAFVGNYFSNETNGTLFLGNFSQGQTVNVRVEVGEGENVNLLYSEISELHMELVSPVLEKLGQNGMQVTRHKGGGLSGKINVAEGQKIMTSIPYDEGWSVWIDGEKAETEMFAGTFMAVKCPAGEHEVRFSYTSPGVTAGFAISIISILIALLYFTSDRLRQALKSKLAPEAMR